MGSKSSGNVMETLILRFNAPMMSFGGVAVDCTRVTEEFPFRSLITGLLANALGYDHREWSKTQRLQERIRYAVRCDRRGEHLVDFQTVDLSQDFLHEGWTTRGAPEGRSGSVSTGTHIRYRHYLANAIYTVAVSLIPAEEAPNASEIAFAMRNPARPLFIGRKCCIPSSPVYLHRRHAETLREAIEKEPMIAFRYQPDRAPIDARWPPEDGDQTLFLTEDKDWRNQIHVGRSEMAYGKISPIPYYLQIKKEESC